MPCATQWYPPLPHPEFSRNQLHPSHNSVGPRLFAIVSDRADVCVAHVQCPVLRALRPVL